MSFAAAFRLMFWTKISMMSSGKKSLKKASVIAVEPEGSKRNCNTMNKQRGGR